METKYTSLELSTKLKDAKCKLRIEHSDKKVWYQMVDGLSWAIGDFYNVEETIEHFGDDRKSGTSMYPTYDILNDICVKFAKEFFGERKEVFGGKIVLSNIWHTTMILKYLQEGKKQEAEDYIWKYCNFNKEHLSNKNKQLC